MAYLVDLILPCVEMFEGSNALLPGVSICIRTNTTSSTGTSDEFYAGLL